MGSTSWLIRAGFAVAVHVFGLLTSSQVILDDKLLFCNSTANITSDCCLPCDINATCNNTCPEGQLSLNFTQRFPTCVFSNDTDASSTSSEDTSRDFLVVCVEACPVKYYTARSRCEKCDDVCERCIGPGIKENCTCSLRYNGQCVETCREGFYNDTGICTKCDDACKNCSASGRGIEICNCKFEFNGTCFDSCYPNITDCDVDGDDENNLTIIIAASAGGAAAVIVVVVVVIVIIVKGCRRKRKTKSRMSTIIENRDVAKDEEEETDIQLPMQIKGKKPGKYENVQVLGGAVSAQAQDTQDKMTRYAKDPTLPRGKTLQDQMDASNRQSTLYENEDSIKLHRNLVKREDSNTKLKHGVFSKLKQSVKNRKSKKKRDSHGGISGSSNPVFNDFVSSTDGDEYVDMSGKIQEEPEQEDYVQVTQQKHDEPQEDYENFQNTSKIDTADEPQDDYENFRNTSRISNIDDEPQDEYENFGMTSIAERTDDEPQDDYENFGNTSKVGVIDDDPQEEYENFRPVTTFQEESPYINVKNFRKETT
ncbi:uncharacterized protein LOC117316617 [Pecten maximus]|uniref:uncharacterized protein LOC117316617 n=1 Tax=Pecten maximus TaxID=6579 RepID=UPI0014580FD5|nr:uncharacterized protein LOC117316617 [Pecten maximus]